MWWWMTCAAWASSPDPLLDALDAELARTMAAWDGEDLLGCGALRALDDRHGEIKAMRTTGDRRRRGVGARILERLLEEAERRGYETVYLETGAFPAFEPARALYRKYGFRSRGPFGDYREDPNSAFMELALPR